MIKQYTKKPIIISALQYTGNNLIECQDFVGRNYNPDIDHPGIITLEGLMNLSKNDYIIKGIAGEFYPCKPEIFEMTYDEVVN